MQIGWRFLTGMALVLAALPGIPRAEDRDWSQRSPLAFGEPMEDCAPRDPALAMAGEPLPAKEGLARPAAAQQPTAVQPAVIQPAVVQPEPAAGPAAETRAQAPRPIPMATLLTFALMASSGSALPQNPGPVK